MWLVDRAQLAAHKHSTLYLYRTWNVYAGRTKSRVLQTIEVSESNERQDRPTIETIQTLLLYAVLELRFNYHISLNLVAHYITVIIHDYSGR